MKIIITIFLLINIAIGKDIIIDIGHSEKRGGATSCTGISEYEYNKIFVEELYLNLKKENIDVGVIKPGLSLKDRYKIVNLNKPKVFLSIHHDSVKEKYLKYKKVKGKKQHYSNNFKGHSIFVSSKNKEFKESVKFGKDIGKELKEAGFIYTKHHTEKIKGENRELLDKNVGVHDYKDLIVLKYSKVPSVLLEVGVIVNEKEEKELRKKEYRKKMIKAITKGIKNYIN